MARTETFNATRPDGAVVVVTRNIDTGEQSLEGAGPVQAAPAAESEPGSTEGADPAKRKPGRPRKAE